MRATTKSGITTDKRMIRFIGALEEWQDDIWSVYLIDLDESFWFTGKEKVQEFLNEQVLERFYDKELRKGYFNYVNDHEEVERYHLEELSRGRIIKFSTTIVEEE